MDQPLPHPLAQNMPSLQASKCFTPTHISLQRDPNPAQWATYARFLRKRWLHCAAITVAVKSPENENGPRRSVSPRGPPVLVPPCPRIMSSPVRALFHSPHRDSLRYATLWVARTNVIKHARHNPRKPPHEMGRARPKKKPPGHRPGGFAQAYNR